MAITAKMKHLKIPKVSMLFRVAIVSLCSWFIGAVIYIIASRIAYPFDLEWMEGGSFVQVLRLLEGKPLYVAPRLNYIPFIYPPLYYYLSAILTRISSINGFLPLRLISAAASTCIAILIYLIVCRRTNSAFWGFIAVGFFAATFQIGGAWFDIARVDMLYVFFLLFGTYFLENETLAANCLAGFLFTCAFFTKQTAVFVIFGLLLYVILFRNKKVALITGLIFLIIVGFWIVLENTFSGGWFWYYIFYLPGLHSLSGSGISYLGQPIFIIFPVIIATAVGFLRFLLSPLAVLRGKDNLWLVFALIMLASSILGSINPGSFNNNYIPFYVAISIIFGINLPWLLDRLASPALLFRQALLYTLCTAQFLVLLYNPFVHIPTKADLQAGQAIIASLRAMDGEILFPNHNALVVLAGKKPYAHLIALEEIRGNFGRQESRGWNLLSSEISQAIQSHKFSAIILDQPNDIWIEVPHYYSESSIIYSSPNVFWPVTGGHTRPSYIYTPVKPQP